MREVVGYLPCNVKWSNALRFDPSGEGRCLHFTASTKGTVFVIFSVIPKDKDTWYYVQISPYGVGIFKVTWNYCHYTIAARKSTLARTNDVSKGWCAAERTLPKNWDVFIKLKIFRRINLVDQNMILLKIGCSSLAEILKQIWWKFSSLWREIRDIRTANLLKFIRSPWTDL